MSKPAAPIQNQDTASAKTLVDTALQIAKERQKILEEMRTALISDDHEALKRVASKLCGLAND